ncbi:MAG: aconitase X catalytic domain-containing protein [Actinomycetota bacterium]
MLLTDHDRALASGELGPSPALAMRIILAIAEANDAPRLIDVTRAHIDSCLYHGDAGLDFAEKLQSDGGKVVVPTTLNVSTLDLLHPHLFRGDERLKERGRRLMAAYVGMGGVPTWTCAPYQSSSRPEFGEHVAWAESNAIVFVNSVLGARTDRYGDFIDICAALTGRVPNAGLHRDEHRRARVVFQLSGIPDEVLRSEILFPVVGHLVGKRTGTMVPAIVGLPTDASEDALKALGAAAASSGGVAMFHAVGRTPEAANLAEATGGTPPDRVIDIDMAMLAEARSELSTRVDGPLAAVSVGTPHFSVSEFRILASLISGRTVAPEVEFYVNTSREVLAEAATLGLVALLRAAGIEIVTDTCTYVTPIMRERSGVVMTNSGKMAYYAPGNLGVDIAFGSLVECVESGVSGKISIDQKAWK